MHRMLHRFKRQLLIAGLLGTCFTSIGVEWTSEDGIVSFQLPDDASWGQVKLKTPGAKLMLMETNGAALVFFAAFEKERRHVNLNQEYIEIWKAVTYPKSKAKKLVSGEFFSFKGKRAYKARDEDTKDGVKVRGGTILWMDDDRLFAIVASKNEADPLEDEVIKAFVASTKFLPKAKK